MTQSYSGGQETFFVKNEKVFRSVEFDYKGYFFCFDASSLKNKRGNKKRSIIFNLKKVENNKVVFEVHHKENNNHTNYDEILKKLKKKRVSLIRNDFDEVFALHNKKFYCN